MQQALDYAGTLNIPFVFSSNGDGFVFHDRTPAIDREELPVNHINIWMAAAVDCGSCAFDRS